MAGVFVARAGFQPRNSFGGYHVAILLNEVGVAQLVPVNGRLSMTDFADLVGSSGFNFPLSVDNVSIIGSPDRLVFRNTKKAENQTMTYDEVAEFLLSHGFRYAVSSPCE